MMSFFLPLALLPLVQFSNQKQELLPLVQFSNQKQELLPLVQFSNQKQELFAFGAILPLVL